MPSPRRRLVATGTLLLLGLSACARKREHAADGGSTTIASSTSTDSTEAESGEEHPAESETGEPDPTGGMFVPPGDCGSFYCTPTSCDVFEQDCPFGEKCTIYASTGTTWDATRCELVLGELEPGEPCTHEGPATAIDDCGASSMCYDGFCRSFCTGTPEDPSCAAGHGCAYEDETPLALCLARCDPLAQDCAAGSCYSHNEQFLCNPSGAIESGQPCGFVNDCAPGNACMDAELVPSCMGAACCSPFCNLEQPDCTMPGTECVAWFEPGQAPAGLELMGVCLSP
jgi:hypothetical protein